jgi:hypothetical protein
MTRIPADDIVKGSLRRKGTFTGPLTVHKGQGPGRCFISEVTADARRVVGQWPTAESVIERLAAGDSAGVRTRERLEQKNRLMTVARELADSDFELIGLAAFSALARKFWLPRGLGEPARRAGCAEVWLARRRQRSCVRECLAGRGSRAPEGELLGRRHRAACQWPRRACVR